MEYLPGDDYGVLLDIQLPLYHKLGLMVLLFEPIGMHLTLAQENHGLLAMQHLAQFAWQ